MQSPVVQLVDGFPVLDTGRCRHPVTIWQQGPSSPPQYDAAGPVLSWQPVTTAMAAIEKMRATEMVKAGQDVSRVFAELTFWYQDGIDGSMHVTDEYGMTYLIQAVDDVEQMHVVLRLSCIQLGANQ